MPLSARRQERQRHWVIRPADERRNELAKELKVSPLLAQLLVNREIIDSTTARAFLNPRLTELIEPEKMPGVTSAVEIIKRTIETADKITVYGDYDVDGITGVTILWQVLTMLGAKVDYYIPHRIDEGYGLNEKAIKALAKAGSKLLITVDCGANATGCAELAQKLGIKLIITDHHQLAPELPNAAALVHPGLDQSYANQDSAGSMVAFKLAWAIANRFNNGRRLSGRLRDFMINAVSLAAMGTVADVVDLRGENRILTSCGLKALGQCGLCGVAALIDSANLTGERLSTYHIGYRLAPMLNAAGRMGHARLAVELLTTDNETLAGQIAEYLKDQNTQRQKCERKIFKQACKIIAATGLDEPAGKTVVLSSDDWHSGVMGIVASRIVDKFNRPTIMINTSGIDNGGSAQGSGRSIPGFDIFKAIAACSQHLIRFGGHKMAAGIRIKPEKVEQFAADFESYARQNLSSADCTPKMHIDAVAPLSAFGHHIVEQLQMLEPFGQGNPQPLFAADGVSIAMPPRCCGANGAHLQLVVTDHTSTIRCIGFGMGKLEKKLLENEFFDIAFRPQLNNYNGNTNVELVLEDIRFE